MNQPTWVPEPDLVFLTAVQLAIATATPSREKRLEICALLESAVREVIEKDQDPRGPKALLPADQEKILRMTKVLQELLEAYHPLSDESPRT